MQDPTAKLIDILARYASGGSPADISATTDLAALDIDVLDIPMIFLDLEDAFDVGIVPGTGFEGLTSVGDLLAVVQAALDARHRPRQPAAPRKKSNWMSTSARA